MINTVIDRCGHVKIYQGDTRPYFQQFHNQFRPIFQSWFSEEVKPYMVNGAKAKAYKNLSHTTISRRVKTLKRAFKLLVSDDIIHKNPMDH